MARTGSPGGLAVLGDGAGAGQGEPGGPVGDRFAELGEQPGDAFVFGRGEDAADVPKTARLPSVSGWNATAGWAWRSGSSRMPNTRTLSVGDAGTCAGSIRS